MAPCIRARGLGGLAHSPRLVGAQLGASARRDGARVAREAGGGRAWVPRRYVVGALCITGITAVFLLRSVMNIASLALEETFTWSASTKGLVLAAFFWGYFVNDIVGDMREDITCASHIFLRAAAGTYEALSFAWDCSNAASGTR